MSASLGTCRRGTTGRRSRRRRTANAGPRPAAGTVATRLGEGLALCGERQARGGVARQFLADASGRVVHDPVDGSDPAAPPLRVPVYSAPKPVADLAGPDEISFRGSDARAVLNLSGRAVDQGTGDEAYRSLVTVLAL